MKKKFSKMFPNFEDRKIVDRHMGELDLHGVSRREFLAFATASAVVSGSIVVTGNIVYWFEEEGRCAASKFSATT